MFLNDMDESDIESVSIKCSVFVSFEESNDTRRLQFKRAINFLKVFKEFHGQKDGALLIDPYLLQIPRIDKTDFVRKWIEIHSPLVPDTNESFPPSPILVSSTPKRIKKSPILGKSRKRTKGRVNLNNNTIHNPACMHSNDAESKVSKENVRRILFNTSPAAASAKVTDANVSPTLCNHSYLYKKRQRLPEKRHSCRKAMHPIDNTHIANSTSTVPEITKSPILSKDSYTQRKAYTKPVQSSRKKILPRIANIHILNRRIVRTMNSVVVYDMHKEKTDIMTSQEQCALRRKMDNANEISSTESKRSNNANVLKDVIPVSPVSEKKLRKVAGTEKIQAESSNEESARTCKEVITIDSESEANSSLRIEDVDTQDVNVLAEMNKQTSTSNNSKAVSMHSQSSVINSDVTFFSKAQFQDTGPSTSTSQKISQVTSQANGNSNKSSQNEIIAISEGTPEKTNSSSAIYFDLLDSGKKRKRAKMGTLAGKAHLALQKHISFVRIWKHQIRQMSKINTPRLPRIVVYVQHCLTYFSKHLFKGIVIEDSSNLLSRDTESSPRRGITIVTGHDTTGKIDLKSENIVQIFPPWKILNSVDLTLFVSYIRAIASKDNFVTEKNNAKIEYDQQSYVNEYNCPCIRDGKIVRSCNNHFSKLDAVEKLFIE